MIADGSVLLGWLIWQL